MAHKTMVSGTAYNVTGGTTLVDGTGYSIKGGKTLVDGTAYDISFVTILPLNDYTWAEISEISSSGQASNYFAVGDTKQITINGTVGLTTFSNLSIWAFIIGFDHNSTYEGTNTIHFQIGKSAQTSGENLCLIDSEHASSAPSQGYFNMSTSFTGNVNQGGWKSSSMRTTILGNNNAPTSPLSGSLIAALPSDLRNRMKAVVKYSDNTGGGSNTASYVTSTTDYLWLLAEYEVFGTQSYANRAEKNYQAQYAYYTNGNSKVKYGHSDTSSRAYWWLRSVYASNKTRFCYVSTTGRASYTYAYNSNGVAPAFCI